MSEKGKGLAGIKQKKEKPLTIDDAELKSVLTRIPDCAPKDFKEGAEKVASWITSLDEDPGEAIRDGEIRRWVSNLARTEWVARVEAFKDIPMMQTDVNISLPVWLEKQFLLDNDLIEKGGIVGKGFSREYGQAGLAAGFGDWERVGDDEYFRRVGEVSEENELSSVNGYKVYLEGGAIETLVSEEKLADFFKELKSKGLLPRGMKLHEGDRLVMYYRDKTQQVELVSEVAESFGIRVRGPAQDLYRVVSGVDGAEWKDHFSNDQALGGLSKGYDFEYDQKQFLEKYLLMMLRYGKKPDNPYLTSYVYFDEGLRGEAERMTNLPVIEWLKSQGSWLKLNSVVI